LRTTIIIPIADSAGYAHDQIGAVFLFLKQNPEKYSATLHADERFEQMIAHSALHHGLQVGFVSYKRGSYPVNSEGRQQEIVAAQQLATAHAAEIFLPEQIAEILKNKGHTLTDSAVGSLLAKPHPWFIPSAEDYAAARHTLEETSALARARTNLGSTAPVKFVFFFGGKSLTDAEDDIEYKRLGGMIKSIGADDQMIPMQKLQEAGIAQGIVIVPVFAQYGNHDELTQRIANLNSTWPTNVAPIVDLGVDWNFFHQPATIMCAASQNFQAAVIGNGSTPHHQALAATSPEGQMSVIIMRPSWSDVPGETRWDAAEKEGIVTIATATQPTGYSYSAMMDLINLRPAEAQKLIIDTSRNSSHLGYGFLARLWAIPVPPEISFDIKGQDLHLRN